MKIINSLDLTKESAVRKAESPPPNLPHAILQIIGPLTKQIDDYPTLICLSLTCGSFYDPIHNSSTILPQAFMSLEQEQPVKRAKSTRRVWEHHDFCGPGYWRLLFRPEDSPCGRVRRHTETGKYICNFDFLRHNTCQLPTLEWLPCYGCMKIRRRDRCFFDNQVDGCLRLLACNALDRRCVDCLLADPELYANFEDEFSTQRGQFLPPSLYTARLRYLVDMPRDFPGFRLRCSMCRKVEWILTGPGRKQKSLKLCEECFRRWLMKDEEKQKLLREFWSVLAEFPVVPGRAWNARSRRGVIVLDEDEDKHGDELEFDLKRLVVQLKSPTLFDVLALGTR